MTFSEKLKKAMQDLNIGQSQVVGLTGKSKASVSQYIAGRQTPSEKTQSDIAVSLGLSPDYFQKEDAFLPKAVVKHGAIPKLEVEAAAKLLGMNHDTVRKGLKQGVFPWGYAIHTSENRWAYFINAKRFAEIEGGVHWMKYERLTHPRNSGIKSGFWSPNKKDELVARLAEYEETGLSPSMVRDLIKSEKDVRKKM